MDAQRDDTPHHNDGPPTPGPVNAGVELRVHGIGDHDVYSALGRVIYDDDEESQVRVGLPPKLPKHDLRLVNWSRASRGINRSVIWYLAFPFTMLNVAGYMAPLERQKAPVSRMAIATVGVITTLVAAIWYSAILETILSAIFSGSDSWPIRAAIAALPALIMIITISWRHFKGTPLSNRGAPHVAFLTIVCLCALAAWLYSEPASRQWPTGWPAVSGKNIDPLLLATSVSMLMVVAIALVFVVGAVRKRVPITFDGGKDPVAWQSKDGAAVAAIALLTVTTLVMVHTVGSLVRLAPATLAYFYGYIKGSPPAQPNSPVVLPPLQEGVATYWFDLIPVVSAAGVAFFCVCLGGLYLIFRKSAGVRARTRDPVLYGDEDDQDRPRQQIGAVHDLLSDISSFLPYAVLLTVAFTAVAWGWFLWSVWHGTLAFDADKVFVGVQLPSLLVVLFVVFRRPERLGDPLRNFFAYVADISGFWSPDLVPLAGTSYRPEVIDTIRKDVSARQDMPIALVGHSQGSVICAWFMAFGLWEENKVAHDSQYVDALSGPGQQSRHISLVTCGSPLMTLYETFFPSLFCARFFTRVQQNSKGGEWFNFWRRTDPIATNLNCAVNFNVTEIVGDKHLGHGEYWTEEKQQDAVGRALTKGVLATGREA